MMTFTAQFDIYGLPVEVTSDHPLLYEMVAEELRTFRAKRRFPSQKIVRLILTALPSPYFNGAPYPALFAPYRELETKRFIAPRTAATLYWKNAITVIQDFKKGLIQTAVVPEPSLIPDPAYHYCFTQPISPWLKKRGFFFLHAGCIAQGKQGILIAGPPRSGKSVLSLSAVRAGFQFLGDEQPILSIRDGGLKVHAFHRRIRLDRSVAILFPELRPLLRTPYSERIVFPLESIWPGSLGSSCQPRVLLFPRFRIGGGLRLKRLDPTYSLGRLLQDDYLIWYRNKPWSWISHEHLNLLEHLVRETKSYELEYSKKEILRIPELFRELLRS